MTRQYHYHYQEAGAATWWEADRKNTQEVDTYFSKVKQVETTGY